MFWLRNKKIIFSYTLLSGGGGGGGGRGRAKKIIQNYGPVKDNHAWFNSGSYHCWEKQPLMDFVMSGQTFSWTDSYGANVKTLYRFWMAKSSHQRALSHINCYVMLLVKPHNFNQNKSH